MSDAHPTPPRPIPAKNAQATSEARLLEPPPIFLGLLFVVLWSTGFVVARAQAPYGEPLFFLALRFALVALLYLAVVWVIDRPKSVTRTTIRDNVVAGMLLHGVYLGGVFVAVDRGLPGGVAALFAALSPILTGILSGPVLGEKVSRAQWVGLVAGFAGVALTVWPKLGTTGYTLWPLMIVLVASASFSFGSLYQRSSASKAGLLFSNALQFLGALLVVLPLSLLLEPFVIPTAPQYWLAMAWSILGLSVGAVSIFIYLLRRGAVSKASALLFLVPGVAALMTFVLFGETLETVQLVGFAVTMLAVALATGRLGELTARR